MLARLPSSSIMMGVTLEGPGILGPCVAFRSKRFSRVSTKFSLEGVAFEPLLKMIKMMREANLDGPACEVPRALLYYGGAPLLWSPPPPLSGVTSRVLVCQGCKAAES